MASKEIDKLNNPVVKKAIKKEGRFLKQLSDKQIFIENHISINEIIPQNILYFNKKYYF